MDDTTLLGHLGEDRDALAALAGAELTADVAGCPGWDLHHLLGHLGLVHRMAGRMVATAPGSEPPPATEKPPAGEAVVGWLVEGLDRLIADLEARGPDQPCVGWAGPTDVRWWLRRQTHETAVHRWDAELAAGRPAHLDGDLAADGISEWLEIQPLRGYRPPAGLRGTIHLHGTDGDGEWLVRLGDELTWEQGHHKGDVAVRSERDRLLLACWGRIPGAELERFGDAALWDAFIDSLRFRAGR